MNSWFCYVNKFRIDDLPKFLLLFLNMTKGCKHMPVKDIGRKFHLTPYTSSPHEIRSYYHK